MSDSESCGIELLVGASKNIKRIMATQAAM